MAGAASIPVDIEDHAALEGYLRRSGHVGQNEPLQFRTLAGGVSNKTVRVGRPAAGQAWVVKQALPKLRTKADWFSDPARIRREALALRWLPRLAPPGTITPLVFEDEGQFLLAMEAVPEPHENWKTMLLAGRVEDGHIDQFAALLGAVHRRAAESEEQLADLFDDRSFFESLRLEPYYEYAAAQAPEGADFLRELIHETRQRRLTVVHGDYSPKNVLVGRDGRLVLLDHEVIHWGDPAFDLGFALTHLLSKAHHLPGHRRRLGEAAIRFCETYAAVLGPVYWDANLQAMACRHTLGCLLARVLGRSPLEYLSEPQRRRQREWAIAAMRARYSTPADLIAWFFSFAGIADATD
jgi:5-methylthioribose kinase